MSYIQGLRKAVLVGRIRSSRTTKNSERDNNQSPAGAHQHPRARSASARLKASRFRHNISPADLDDPDLDA